MTISFLSSFFFLFLFSFVVFLLFRSFSLNSNMQRNNNKIQKLCIYRIEKQD